MLVGHRVRWVIAGGGFWNAETTQKGVTRQTGVQADRSALEALSLIRGVSTLHHSVGVGAVGKKNQLCLICECCVREYNGRGGRILTPRIVLSELSEETAVGDAPGELPTAFPLEVAEGDEGGEGDARGEAEQRPGRGKRAAWENLTNAWF